MVNANRFDSKCAVYLDGGPGPNAPARAAGLQDGEYYFQVTDPSGAHLLSTDAVSNRRFRVAGGVIVQYTGSGGPIHPTGIDQDHAAQGAITIRLANLDCPADFVNTPNTGDVYKVGYAGGQFQWQPSKRRQCLLERLFPRVRGISVEDRQFQSTVLHLTHFLHDYSEAVLRWSEHHAESAGLGHDRDGPVRRS